MTKFEITLLEIQRRLNLDSRLSHHRKIWCQGCIKPNIKLLLTRFNSSSYDMKFISFKNFTYYKDDSDNQGPFESQLESIVDSLI